jgi:3-methyl-2-oxobutanoate hydroxymethyltransferase
MAIMKQANDRMLDKYRSGVPLAMLTCYDFPTARLLDEAGIDVVLVGDSVGTNVLGYGSEREVTMQDMLHHLRAVVRGISRAGVVVDLPYRTYDSPQPALSNARLLIDAGADAVKLEGAATKVVRALTEDGICVWGHLGLNPQIHDEKRLQARDAEAAIQLLEEAEGLAAAGAAFLILEMIPEVVAQAVTERLTIPTIGIGAGRYTDGQVLVIHDLLGMTQRTFRHSRKYEDLRGRIAMAVAAYCSDLSRGAFPGPENARGMQPEEAAAFARLLALRDAGQPAEE